MKIIIHYKQGQVYVVLLNKIAQHITRQLVNAMNVQRIIKFQFHQRVVLLFHNALVIRNNAYVLHVPLYTHLLIQIFAVIIFNIVHSMEILVNVINVNPSNTIYQKISQCVAIKLIIV